MLIPILTLTNYHCCYFRWLQNWYSDWS